MGTEKQAEAAGDQKPDDLPPPVSESTGPWHCPPPVRKKPTQPRQCRRAFLLRAAGRDCSILESLFSAMWGRGREEGEDLGHFGSGGCEFLSGLGSVVAAQQLSSHPEDPAVWLWSCQGRLPACSKPAWRAR